MYDYHVMVTSDPPSKTRLDELSVEGWDLVSVLPSIRFSARVYTTYLRRVKGDLYG